MREKSGFTLIEILIVLAIIGILSAIAYPIYHSHVLKAHRAQAKITLIEIAGKLEQYHVLHQSYAGANLENLAIKPPENFYQYTIATTPNNYTISAIPQGSQSQDHCGTLSYQDTGQKSPSMSACW